MKRSVPLWFVMMPFLVVGSVPAMAHVIARVSVSSAGVPNNHDCLHPWMSGDGRYVAFASWASNLVPGDTNGTYDVFVHDCTTGQTTRVSVSSAGGEGDGGQSGYCSTVLMSNDGRFVLFDSYATGLAPGPLNPDGDLYVHDCLTGDTTLVPRPADQGYGLAYPTGGISGDGRYVWRFDQVNAGGALTEYGVVSIYDRQMDTLTEAFRGDCEYLGPLSVSADGRLCAYHRDNVPGDGGHGQIYVYDRLTSQQEMVSLSSSATVGNGGSQEPAMSPDGRWVAFVSNATNLVPDDTNSHDDVFVRDRQTGQTERVSVSSSEEQGNGDSDVYPPSALISADGRFVAFLSQATNLVVGDTNGLRDVFVRDRQAGETSRADVDASGNEANGFARGPSISADGRFVVFPSTATNLVPIPPLNEGEWGLDVFLARNVAATAPSRPTVDVTPDVPETDDDLTCTITQPSIDPNDDPITYRYGWYKADVHQADYDDLTTVPASVTTKGETWKCVVTPNDGTEDGPSGEDSATIANTAPTQPAVDVAPDAPMLDDDLTCAVTEDSTDADDDTVTYQYRWYKDDVQQADYDDLTTVPASATAKGDVWKCVVTPTDGTDDGPSDEDQVTVDGPYLEWAGTAGYETDGVDPDIGNGSGADSPTTFTFKVKYTDPSGSPPLISQCWIQKRADDGGWAQCKTAAMTLESGSIATGAIYSCAVVLPNETLKYRFYFKAADGTPVDGPPTVYGDGPFIIGRPRVSWIFRTGFETDGVDPDSGPLGTNFKFQVKYADSEGDAPTVCDLVLRRNGRIFRQKPMSPAPNGDLRLGWIYRTSVTITKPGVYDYRFHFADASGNALGPPNNWTSGPTITDGSSGAAVTSLAAVPTARGAQITFSLLSAANVTATVVNVAGRPIRTIVADKPLDAGLQTLLWNRCAETGLAVPSGLYLIRVAARNADGGVSTALTTVSLR